MKSQEFQPEHKLMNHSVQYLNGQHLVLFLWHNNNSFNSYLFVSTSLTTCLDSIDQQTEVSLYIQFFLNSKILKYVSNKQLLTNLPKYLIFFTWSICEFYLYIWNTAGLDEPPLCSHPGTVGMRWASEGDQPSQRHASSRGPAGPKPDHNTEWWTRQTVILGWYHMSWYGSCPWKWKLSIKIHGCIKIYCICHFALILSKL